MEIVYMVQPQPVINATNLEGLSQLKLKAKQQSGHALTEVAKQFESLFLQSMMKSMRKATEFISESNPMKSSKEGIYQDMLDAQMAIEMANKRGIGLANVLVEQMGKYVNETNPQEGVAKIVQTGKILPPQQSNADDDTFDDLKDFVSTLWPHAKAAANSIGLDPKLLIAQAALETGWGKYVIRNEQGESSNNLFNIKTNMDWDNESIDVKTKEFFGGSFRDMTASFKGYDTLSDSFSDYIGLLQNSRRYQHALNNTHNPREYIKSLHKAGYATDPNYSEKILSIYKGGELTKALEQLEVN
jgi:peptidoglycan hydrolase FlgJ